MVDRSSGNVDVAKGHFVVGIQVNDKVLTTYRAGGGNRLRIVIGVFQAVDFPGLHKIISAVAVHSDEQIARRPAPVHGRRLQRQRMRGGVAGGIEVVVGILNADVEAHAFQGSHVKTSQRLQRGLVGMHKHPCGVDGCLHSAIMDQGNLGNVVIKQT